MYAAFQIEIDILADMIHKPLMETGAFPISKYWHNKK